MVPNEAEAPFVVLEALNISGVIGNPSLRRCLCAFFSQLRALRGLKPQLGGGGGAVGGSAGCVPPKWGCGSGYNQVALSFCGSLQT